MIPKIIHYCWFGGNPLPYEVKQCIKSWKKYAPDFEIIEWNETNFDVKAHAFSEKAYKEKAWAFVSDYARLRVVYDHGGVYLDTDVELLKPINKLLDHSFYIGVQQGNEFPTTGLGFGAEKESVIVKEMMEQYDSVQFNKAEMKTFACPYLNSKVLYKYGYVYSDEIWKKNDVYVYPPKYFDPLSPGDSENLMCNDTYSIHHYSASWTSKSYVLRRRLFRFVGEHNIHKIKMLLKNNVI